MDLSAPMPWAKKRLRRLGEALVRGEQPPAGCPDYDEVMLWHHELTAAVQEEIAATNWIACAQSLNPTGRAKTVDTLRQKLAREERTHLTLDQVQDLAGVRVDVDCTLDEQTALADEIADHFGRELALVKDIREAPHSGYRAVHVWLRLPAGRVEVQIRTLGQSAWANTFERMGDVFGRGIRYDQPTGDLDVTTLVGQMSFLSKTIATLEQMDQAIADVRRQVASSPDGRRIHDETDVAGTLADLEETITTTRAQCLSTLRDAKQQLDEMGG